MEKIVSQTWHEVNPFKSKRDKDWGWVIPHLRRVAENDETWEVTVSPDAAFDFGCAVEHYCGTIPAFKSLQVREYADDFKEFTHLFFVFTEKSNVSNLNEFDG